jgi:hypothetical protein
MPRNPSDYVSPRLTPWPKSVPLLTRVAAFIGAYAELLWLDLCGRQGFRVLHRTIASRGLAASPASYDVLTLVRVAVRDACVFYAKPVYCLQGSAAVTRMLRRRGVPAQLVIGCQAAPVELHAWVELDGKVVWQEMSRLRFFRVIDRI